MSEPIEMELVVGADGNARCIYDESLDLRAFGKLQITRASRVGPDLDGFWWADIGPVLRPFGTAWELLLGEKVLVTCFTRKAEASAIVT
ncbi:MAG: hypothetical protein RLZZ326_4081 [Planctomycetota bacterium]|jgi:hypothetical protein